MAHSVINSVADCTDILNDTAVYRKSVIKLFCTQFDLLSSLEAALNQSSSWLSLCIMIIVGPGSLLRLILFIL